MKKTAINVSWCVVIGWFLILFFVYVSMLESGPSDYSAHDLPFGFLALYFYAGPCVVLLLGIIGIVQNWNTRRGLALATTVPVLLIGFFQLMLSRTILDGYDRKREPTYFERLIPLLRESRKITYSKTRQNVTSPPADPYFSNPTANASNWNEALTSLNNNLVLFKSEGFSEELQIKEIIAPDQAYIILNPVTAIVLMSADAIIKDYGTALNADQRAQIEHGDQVYLGAAAYQMFVFNCPVGNLGIAWIGKASGKATIHLRVEIDGLHKTIVKHQVSETSAVRFAIKHSSKTNSMFVMITSPEGELMTDQIFAYSLPEE